MAGCRGSPDKVPRPEQCEQRTSCNIPNLQVLFQDFIWFQRQKRNTAQPKWITLGRAQDKPSAANRKDVLDERWPSTAVFIQNRNDISRFWFVSIQFWPICGTTTLTVLSRYRTIPIPKTVTPPNSCRWWWWWWCLLFVLAETINRSLLRSPPVAMDINITHRYTEGIWKSWLPIFVT
jgi:hypothetical protein